MRGKSLLLLYPGMLHSPGWGDLADENTHMVYVYAFLKKYFDVTAVDLEAEFGRPRDDRERQRFKEMSLERILASDAGWVGISCWSSLNYLSAKYFAEKIKQEKPGTKIFVGGYHPSFQEEDFRYEGSPFDFVVKGEVDRALDIPGLSRLKGGESPEARPDFASYPYARLKRNVGVFLSTGCAFRCSYCMEYRRKWRPLGVFEAVETIREIEQELAPQAIMILDACFGLDPKWRKRFLAELAKEERRSGFWFQTRTDLLDDEDVESLSRLNVRIDLGVDSFSRTMLGIMRKTAEPEAYLDRFVALSRKCSELRIEHDAYLIFNHPGESESTVQEHELFLESRVLPELAGGYLWVRSGTFSLFPGSFVFNNLDAFRKQYGTTVEHPRWWREEGDQLALSRRLVPSRDPKGKPFVLSPQRVGRLVGELNRSSQRFRPRTGKG